MSDSIPSQVHYDYVDHFIGKSSESPNIKIVLVGTSLKFLNDVLEIREREKNIIYPKDSCDLKLEFPDSTVVNLTKTLFISYISERLRYLPQEKDGISIIYVVDNNLHDWKKNVKIVLSKKIGRYYENKTYHKYKQYREGLLNSYCIYTY